jgi:glucose-1-phosphate thymidylyltransferase
MKALVLAGGRGTRLRPLTHTSAKQLVPVANKPVLFYGLEAIRDAGITEVGIVIGETGEEIKAAVGDGSSFGLSVTYLPQEAPLGLAHCVLISREFLGDEDFVMYLGDNFLIGGITDVVTAFRTGGYDAQVTVTQVPEPQLFGVAELGPGDEVIALQEKPSDPRSNLAVVGVYLFTPAIHEAVRAITPSARGELEITHALQWLIDQGRHIQAHVVSGYWKDTGRLEDMLECNRIVLEGLEPRLAGKVSAETVVEGRVVVEEGAMVEESVLRGPVVIGAGARIQRSYIGPFTSVGEGCAVIDAEIEYSIVLGNSSIEGVSRIEHSLIGRDVEVVRAPAVPNTHQLMVGDHSRVQIPR